MSGWKTGFPCAMLGFPVTTEDHKVELCQWVPMSVNECCSIFHELWGCYQHTHCALLVSLHLVSIWRLECHVGVSVNSHTRETPTSSSSGLLRCEDNRGAQWCVHTRCEDKQSEWWSLNFCLMLVASVHVLFLNGILDPWPLEKIPKRETLGPFNWDLMTSNGCSRVK